MTVSRGLPLLASTFEVKSGKVIGRIASIDDSTLNILFCLEDSRLICHTDDLITAIDQQARAKLP